MCRSQWPRGLRRGSAAARFLGLRVRIPPGVCISVSCECCVWSGRGLCDELITLPEEPYRGCWVVVCDLETSWMRSPWPALDRSDAKKNLHVLRIKACVKLNYIRCAFGSFHLVIIVSQCTVQTTKFVEYFCAMGVWNCGARAILATLTVDWDISRKHRRVLLIWHFYNVLCITVMRGICN